MKVLFYVLNNAELLSSVLKELSAVGVNGCTIFDTDGMGRELAKLDCEFKSMFGGLRTLLKPSTVKNKTLMIVLDEDRIETVISAIENVTGNLDLPETGILFSLPLDFVKGIKL